MAETVSSMSIGIVGNFDPDNKTHLATNEAIAHAGAVFSARPEARWIATESIEPSNAANMLGGFDAIWLAPGSPYRSMEGALTAIRYAREKDVVTLGTCGGFQHMALEFARNVLNFHDAQHAEYDPYASRLFIDALPCSLAGKKLEVRTRPGSMARRIYGREVTEEEYYCNFGLNPEYDDKLGSAGFEVSGRDRDGAARIIEMPDHRFYIGTLFVPQTLSQPLRPHPMIVEYISAALDVRKQEAMGNGLKAHKEAEA